MFISRLHVYVLLALILAYGNKAWAELPPVNPYPEQKELIGKFVWFDLVTNNVSSAQAFYQKVFGWKFETHTFNKQSYELILSDGRAIGTVIRNADGKDGVELSQWVGYISAPDVKADVERALQDGGRLIAPPTGVQDWMEYAIISDNQGAVVGMIDSASDDLPDYLPGYGQPFWSEYWAAHPQQVADFYREIFGYQLHTVEDDKHKAIYLVSEGHSRASVVKSPDANIRAAWLHYFRVENLEASVKAIREAGGRVFFTMKASEAASPMAMAADPTGAVFGMSAWNPKQQPQP